MFIQNYEDEEHGTIKKVHKENVIFFKGDSFERKKYEGGCEKFMAWVNSEYGYDDARTNKLLYKRIARKQWHHLMAQTGRRFFKMEFEVEGESIGDITVEMFTDVCPQTCEKVLEFVNGDLGKSYVGSPIHRVVPGGWIQGGDLVEGKGNGVEEEYFPDETFAVKHDRPGIIGLANRGPHTNSSQFYITTSGLPWLDGKKVAFGRVVDGLRLVHVISKMEAANQRPVTPCTVKECFEIKLSYDWGYNK